MVIATSDSCGTLISLNEGRKGLELGSEGPACDDLYVKTCLNLPKDEFLELPETDQQPIYLPRTSRVDESLKHIPEVVERCDEFLAATPILFHSESSEQVLYVAQGELAHAQHMQADVLVSDKATTCHIAAFRSESHSNLPLNSMAHVDNTCYEDCIRDVFREHILHHRETSVTCEQKSEFNMNELIDFQVHIVGGFNDFDETSSKISDWLLRLVAQLAEEYKDDMNVTLETCAISGLNDNGYSCPIGRGLGLNLHTGDVFLAKVDGGANGPAGKVRSVRVWSAPTTLSVIHTSRSNVFKVNAFFFQQFAEIDQLLELPDSIFLQYTSTSPDVEEDDFCALARSTLSFLRSVDCSTVFGERADQSLFFQRVEGSNSWTRVA